MMRPVMAAAAAAVTILSAAPAQAGGYAPWCAVHSMGRGDAYWDCHFATLDQCVPEVIAGNRGFCNPNPAFAGPSPVYHHRRVIRRRLRHY